MPPSVRPPPPPDPRRPKTPGSPLQAHLRRWAAGCGGECCAAARNVCLVRGTVPCDVLLVGEAPGVSEDVVGRPFVGPAGHLLDEICRRALSDLPACLTCRRRGVCSPVLAGREGEPPACTGGHVGPPSGPLRLAFTNVVGCVPREETGETLPGGRAVVHKAAEPALDDILRCAPRVAELAGLARPALVVAVGRVAAEWLDQGARYKIPLPGRPDGPTPQVRIDHPAAVLRANVTLRGLMVQRAVAALRGAVLDLTPPAAPA